MRLKRIKNPHLYDSLLRQTGGTAVHQGIPWVPPHRGGFRFLSGPLIKMASSMAKNMLPSIGKRVAKEVLPQLAQTALSTGMDAVIHKRTPKAALKRFLDASKANVLKKGRKIVVEEGKKVLMGKAGRKRPAVKRGKKEKKKKRGKKKGGMRVRKALPKMIQGNTIFDDI